MSVKNNPIDWSALHIPSDAWQTDQRERLAEALAYAAQNSPYYGRTLGKINPIQFSQDPVRILKSLPFTTKDDFSRENDAFLCVDKGQIADFVTTSGTLGHPVSYYLTDRDLERLGINEAGSYQCAGATSADVFMLMTTIDKRFMAGLAYFLGARKMAAGIVRNGPGVPYLQWDSIERFQPTYLIAVPSFIPALLKYAEEHGIDYQSSSVKGIICIGEPIRKDDFSLNELGERIRAKWNIALYSTYASTEMATAFTECEAGKGGHMRPDLIYLEVLDPEGNEVGDGESGEVVFTTLGVEGMPLIRYRSGDICTLRTEVCSCGRSTPRLGPVLGRKKQMIKYKGTTLFPPVIFDMLDQFEQITTYVVEASTNEYGNDHIRVYLDEELDHFDFAYELKEAFKGRLRVTPEIQFIPTTVLQQKLFPEKSRKPLKFIDLRN
ncbi:MAG: AMP-binding protein [Flavobacteriales bacterium]|nr:AMP-binding protein [Flavobacteriales bacterium]